MRKVTATQRAPDLKAVKVGDTVVRMLAGTLPMELTVTGVTDKLIVCGAWEFSRNNGAEIDRFLDWNESHTGSFLQFQPCNAKADVAVLHTELMQVRLLSRLPKKNLWSSNPLVALVAGKMKYKVLTPSGVESDDTWDSIQKIPRRVSDRFGRYFETEEAELIEIDDFGNRNKLGFLIDNDNTRVSLLNVV